MKANRQCIIVLLIATLIRLTSPQAFGAAAFSDANWASISGLAATGAVSAVAVDGLGNVYAGGGFRIDGVATNIAKWDGTTWSALGPWMGGYVSALAVSGSNVYVGGAFTNAGGTAVNYIAKWDGSSWSALGSGMSGYVHALAVSGNELYAAADLNPSGALANYVAKWNGSSWSALGSGMRGGGVYALAVSGNDLYAGGDFTLTGVNAGFIAKWDGSSWSALGSGGIGGGSCGNECTEVDALAVSGSTVYAGGDFTSAGGIPASFIAEWDGNSWSALGSGVDGGVSALAVAGGNELFAGGAFTTAGGKVSSRFSRADLPVLSILRSGSNVRLSLPASYGLLVLQQNANLANSNTWFTSTYPLATNGAVKTTAVPLGSSNWFFRLIGN